MQRLNLVYIDLIGPMWQQNAFFQCWVSPFGAPQVVVSDNGWVFVYTKELEKLGIYH